VSPAELSFDLLVGQTETKTVSVTDFGTTAGATQMDETADP
jgi:hypothetical protein